MLDNSLSVGVLGGETVPHRNHVKLAVLVTEITWGFYTTLPHARDELYPKVHASRGVKTHGIFAIMVWHRASRAVLAVLPICRGDMTSLL